MWKMAKYKKIGKLILITIPLLIATIIGVIGCALKIGAEEVIDWLRDW